MLNDSLLESHAAIENYAPGTLALEELHDGGRSETILHPRPTDDPNDPLNWSKTSKILNFSLACYYALMVFVLVDIGTVIYQPLQDELGFSVEVLNWSFGANTLGLATGCIVLIPFALKFGRRPLYIFSVSVSLATAIWQAKMQTAGDQYGSGVLSGFAGAIAETICQMTIADLFFVHQRATANGIYLLMVNVGAFLGPVAAGYAADAQGWRWIWWWTTIFLAIGLVAFILLYEETKYTPYHSATSVSDSNPPLRTQKPSDDPARQSVVSGTDVKSSSDTTNEGVTTTATAITTPDSGTFSTPPKRKPYLKRLTILTTSPGNFRTFFRHSYQPFIILFTLPAVAWTAIIYGSLLAWFSIMTSTLSIYFPLPPYNFSSSGIGLMNLPPFIGGAIGSLYGGYLSDWLIVRLAKRNNGVFEPEMRLWLALPAILITPFSLLMFGLTMARGTHWIVPAIGAALFGFGFVTFGDISLTYLMDCYKDLVGDALVAVAFVRNIFATVMVFALSPWIDATGLENMFIAITFIALALFITTIPMLIWGKKLRVATRGRFEKMRARQFISRV